MFKKFIRGREVQSGDVIILDSGQRIEVARTVNTEQYGLGFHGKNGLFTLVPPSEFVELIHRTLPKGDTNRDALQCVVTLAEEVHGLRGYAVGLTALYDTHPALKSAIERLEAVIEIWKLGQPEAENQPRPIHPVNRIDESDGGIDR